MENSQVNLTISKDIVNPIVQAKIQEAILAAMGGSDQVIERVVSTILSAKVDSAGKPSSYSCDSHRTYLDYVITDQIKKAAQEEIANQLSVMSLPIKEALVKHIQSKIGSNMIAKALLDGMANTFKSGWRSSVDVKITPVTED